MMTLPAISYAHVSGLLGEQCCRCPLALLCLTGVYLRMVVCGHCREGLRLQSSPSASAARHPDSMYWTTLEEPPGPVFAAFKKCVVGQFSPVHGGRPAAQKFSTYPCASCDLLAGAGCAMERRV